MTFPFGETATLHTRSGTADDALGVRQSTWTDTVVAGCFLDAGGSIEVVQGQDQVTTQPVLYMPAGTAVTPVDQITVRGDRYEVDGSPNSYVQPWTGWVPPVAVKLKLVTG